MKICISYSSISCILQLLRKKKDGNLKMRDIENVLRHPDYRFEFRRYGQRVSESAFIIYFMNFETLQEEEIENFDLRNHHSFWLDIFMHIDNYEKQIQSFFDKLSKEDIDKAILLVKQSFPSSFSLVDSKLLFTCGIGQSFGYPYRNCIHFDILQLIKNKEYPHFSYLLAHELHHLVFKKNIRKEDKHLEGYFVQSFASEGLAIKFTNNVQGFLSKKRFLDRKENVGLDEFSIQYLNKEFDNTWREFKSDIYKIRHGKINTLQEVNKRISSYWLNCFIEGQEYLEIPKLKQSRYYTFGNEIWGTIYDVYGMETLYYVVNHPEEGIAYFNNALNFIHKEEYAIR